MNLLEATQLVDGGLAGDLRFRLVTVGRSFFDIQRDADAVDLFVCDDSHPDPIMLRTYNWDESVELSRGDVIEAQGVIVHHVKHVTWIESCKVVLPAHEEGGAVSLSICIEGVEYALEALSMSLGLLRQIQGAEMFQGEEQTDPIEFPSTPTEIR